VAKDRTFFFGSYEGLRQDRGVTTIATVPSRATRARADISPATRPFLLLYPEANGRESGANRTVLGPDHVADARGLRAREDRPHDLHGALAVGALFVGQGAGRSGSADSVLDDRHAHAFAVVVGEHKWIVRSNLLNVAKLAWNRAYEATDNIEKIAFDPRLFFVPGTRFGNISVSGLNSLGPDTNTPTFVDLKSLQLIENVTWSRSSHNVKIGLNYTHYIRPGLVVRLRRQLRVHIARDFAQNRRAPTKGRRRARRRRGGGGRTWWACTRRTTGARGAT